MLFVQSCPQCANYSGTPLYVHKNIRSVCMPTKGLENVREVSHLDNQQLIFWFALGFGRERWAFIEEYMRIRWKQSVGELYKIFDEPKVSMITKLSYPTLDNARIPKNVLNPKLLIQRENQGSTKRIQYTKITLHCWDSRKNRRIEIFENRVFWRTRPETVCEPQWRWRRKSKWGKSFATT